MLVQMRPLVNPDAETSEIEKLQAQIDSILAKNPSALTGRQLFLKETELRAGADGPSSLLAHSFDSCRREWSTFLLVTSSF